MKRRIGIGILVLSLLLSLFATPVYAAYELPPDKEAALTAQSALVVFLGSDMPRDMVMYEKNPDARMAPGGMVRVMVGLYALKTLEDQKIDPAVATGTYTEELYDLIAGQDLETAGMQYGDVWRVEDLLYMGVMCTAADAVGALSVALAGSHDKFVEGMNALAAEIGCTDTHFQNVFGLDHAEQYTTARDMYRILRYANLHMPQLCDILGTTEYTPKPVVGEADTWTTANLMLRPSSEFYYAPLVYGRTGNSGTEGRAAVSVARDGGFEFLTVVMGCKPAPASEPAEGEGETPAEGEGETPAVAEEGLALVDTTLLFRWVYNNVSYETVVSRYQPITRVGVELAWNTDSIPLVAASDLEGMLRAETKVSALRYEVAIDESLLSESGKLVAPLEAGQICGKATVYDGDDVIGTVELCVAETVTRSQVLAILSAVWGVLTNPFVLILFAVLVALFIGYIVMTVTHNNRRRRKNRQKVKRYR